MSRNKERNFEVENQVSVLLTNMLANSDRTQADITKDMGFKKSNIMTMFKQGRSPFPIKYVVPLCKVLGEDPRPLMEACLREYFPDVIATISEVKKGVFDEDELKIISAVRKERLKHPFPATVSNLNKLRKFIREDLHQKED